MRRLAWWWLIPALLLTFTLGARGLDADAIWYDEYYSIHDAGGAFDGPRSPVDIWVRLAERNPWHTPGFFVLLSGWGALVGWEPAALRVLSLLVGLLAVAWTYRLGADLFTPEVGFYAAALLSASAFFAYYLHEIRMYAPMVALTALTIWLYVRVTNPGRTPTRFDWLGLFGGALSLLYLHYFAALPLLAVGIYHLLFVKKDRRWWAVVGVFGLAGLLFLPWVGTLLAGLALATESDELQARALNNAELALRTGYLFSNGAPLLLLLLIPALWRPQRQTVALLVMLVSLVGAVLLVNATLQIIPATRIRYLITVLPLLLPLLAVGLTRLRLAGPVLLMGWIVTGVHNSTQADYIIDLGGAEYVFPQHVAARVIAIEAEPGDYVLNYLSDATFSSIRSTRLYLRDLPVEFDNRDPDDILAPESVAEWADHERVWLAYTPLEFDELPAPLIDTLRRDFAWCATPVNTPTLHLDLYARLPQCCSTPGAPIIARFGDGITLAGAAPLPQTVTTSLPVSLLWQLDESVPPYRYSVGVKVLDNAGMPVVEHDEGLPVAPDACQQNHLSLAGLPAGTYTLAVTVYAWETGNVLAAEDVATGEQAALLPLATFEVRR